MVRVFSSKTERHIGYSRDQSQACTGIPTLGMPGMLPTLDPLLNSSLINTAVPLLH